MPRLCGAAMGRWAMQGRSGGRRLILALLATGLPLVFGFAGDGVAAIRLQDPANAPAGSSRAASDSAGSGQVVTGPVACVNGHAQNFSCQRVDLLAYLPAAALGGQMSLPFNWGTPKLFPIRVTGLWGWTDSATQRAFALVGRVDGTAFVEVTDPTHPTYLGELPLTKGTNPSAERDIKVYKNHAFIVASSPGLQQPPHGMQVFDLTQLRAVSKAPVTFRETAHYDRFDTRHNIAIDEAAGYAYVISGGDDSLSCRRSGVHMIDIRDPVHPTFAGCYIDPQGSRDIDAMQCVVYHGPDQHYQGRELCLSAASGNQTVTITDVTDKQTPFTVSVATYPKSFAPHQGWLSDDQRYFFLGDFWDEMRYLGQKTRTIVFDLSDLEDPGVVKEFYGTTGATDHNLYVRGSYLYQANHQAGLRILDVADPKNPREVGFFDTTPGDRNTAAVGTGAWTVYPYFAADKNGVVVAVTSVNEGLFLLRFRPERP